MFWYSFAPYFPARGLHSANTSITIGDHFSHFVSEQVRSGSYGSTSDVVRVGLCLLEEHEAHVRALNDTLIAGEQSGAPRPFDFAAFEASENTHL
ncbi:type II toxin-antitoxin system ParD family antitoxin [Sphingobium yanoikuyae]|uniref:Type II toxin-antitoxin system ParD family antitoxin n=1 Tax=Sphingobium yanoikuyae TaxID=13690 RepID=A0A6P1GQD6_SPHYA|nr:type II toxin-antitoxin system ParD family antitoxin [Sphingobium yanoikuyae]